MSSKLNLAVIGAGAMGRDHIKYIQNEENTKLVAIADPVPEVAQYAESLNVPYFANHKEMMDKVKLDGVIIASPNKLHIPMAYDALERNIPTLIEKPISDDLEQAKAFAAAAKAKKAKVLVGQHRRHNPVVQKAKEIIASGKLGKIVTVSCHYMIYKPDDYYDIEWRRLPGAGPILVNMVHDVDLLRYLVGEFSELQGMSANNARGFQVEDSAVVNIRFKNGALGSLTLSDSAVTPWNWETTSRENPFFAPFTDDCYYIAGTQGAITMPQLRMFTYDGKNSWTNPLTCDVPGVKPALPHVMQLKHFCRVITGEQQPIVTPEDAVLSLEALNAIKKAADYGEKVIL